MPDAPQLPPERESLVTANVRWVDFMVEQLHPLMPFMDREELRGEGYMGLVEAAIRWDPERAPFKPFARYRIRGAMFDAARRTRPAFAPQSGPTRDQLLSTSAEPTDDWNPAAALERFGPAQDLDQIRDPVTTLGTRFVNAQLVARIREEWDRLDPEYKELLDAIYLRGISIREYSRQTGLARNTITERINQALRPLWGKLTRGERE